MNSFVGRVLCGFIVVGGLFFGVFFLYSLLFLADFAELFIRR